MALFYKSILSAQVVRAEAAQDSSKIVIENSDGAVSEVSIRDFAAQFVLVDPQPESFPAPAPVVAEAPKEPKAPKANA